MNLAQLKYIVEVEKTGSISKAAQSLFVGQPNLSKSIKELENELGIIIFKRTPKGTQTTQKGANLIKYAKNVLKQINEIEMLYTDDNILDELRLNICVPRATYFALAFSKFLNKLENINGININYEELNAYETVSKVSNGEADIGIIRYNDIFDDYFTSLIRINGLKSETLYQFKMNILMSNTHPLAHYDVIPYEKLFDYIEVSHGDYDVKGLDVAKQKNEIPKKCINIYDRGSQIDLLKCVHGTFMWASPIPKDFLAYNNLVEKPCSPTSLMNKDIIIYRNGKHLTEYEQIFINTLKY